MNYRPTHVHRDDDSPAMVSNVSPETDLCIITNEDGTKFADYASNWRPIAEAVGHEQIVSEYEAERWRAMSDELLGQATRMRHLAGAHGSRADWLAIECIDRAQANLFGAFGAIMIERQRAES